jgi:hypothetical protein
LYITKRKSKHPSKAINHGLPLEKRLTFSVK